MIYFLQPVDGGPIKIGYTDNLEQRHKDLEKHYGRPLILLQSIGGGRREEQEIHARFAHLRFERTEQFRPGVDLMEFIGRPSPAEGNPDDIQAMGVVKNTIVLQMRAKGAWKAWLEAFAQAEGVTSSGLVDRALQEYAAKHKLVKPPSRV